MPLTPRLKSVVWHLSVCGLVPCLLSAQSTADDHFPPFVKAIDIRSMTPAEADENREVRLRGTVIFADANNAVFLQDETAGTLFWLEKKQPAPLPGDVVEVHGTTRSGLYVPGIAHTRYRVLSRGPMPAPIEATYEDLLSGRYHYQWVSIEGIIRSIHTAVTSDPNPASPPSSDDGGGDTNANTITTGNAAKQRTSMRVAMGSRIVEIRLNEPPQNPDLIDSTVRITGLASGAINDRRQLLLPYLWPHSSSGIEILEPAPDPDQLPTLPATDLLTFRPSGRGTGHRVRMRGEILASFPDGRVFLRDDNSSFAASLTTNALLHPGEHIELLGFPELERFSASLADAQLVTRTPGPPPEPVATNVGELMRGTFDNDLVTITATVGETYRNEFGPVLLLQTSERTLRAQLPSSDPIPPLGSHIQITGICQVESSKPVAYQSRPQTLSIHPRSPADILILQTPPWWTTTRLTVALIGFAIATLLSALWILLLRRQVETQTAALRDQIELQAMLEERQRIAREFHDTLEQDLTGLSLQLGAAASAPPAHTTNLLATARHLVTRIQIETRNLLSDLRTPADQTLPLADILKNLAEARSNENGPTIEVQCDENLPVLPPRTLHHLRMMAQESLANALRHAQATLIQITLARQSGHLLLTVRDNGKGFDPSETWEKPGHYGCMGIRERARKLGAEVRWRSQPDHGTTVEITFPMDDRLTDDKPPA
jgi:signal transduction histidine kinase